MKNFLFILLLCGCGGAAVSADTGPLLCEAVVNDEYSVQADVDEVVTFALLHWRQRSPAQRDLSDARVAYMVEGLGEVEASYDDGVLTVVVDGQRVGSSECQHED